MLSEKIKFFVVFVVGCFIGATAIIFLDCYDMVKPTFWEFSFVDVLHLIVYSLIAIYVAYYLKNRFSDQQMKKNVFLGIVNDIQNILEKELANIESFMKKPNEKMKIRTILTLKKINNKIHVLEINDKGFDPILKRLLEDIMGDYINIKRSVTDDDFGTPRSFTQENMNKMFLYSYKLIFSLDKFKSSIFD